MGNFDDGNKMKTIANLDQKIQRIPSKTELRLTGAPAKMDFLLPELETVVELKMTRPSRSTSELRDELLVDIATYQTHPGCRTLFCIVYDPDGRISNPRGFEADLNGEHGDLVVRVMIVPKGT